MNRRWETGCAALDRVQIVYSGAHQPGRGYRDEGRQVPSLASSTPMHFLRATIVNGSIGLVVILFSGPFAYHSR